MLDRYTTGLAAVGGVITPVPGLTIPTQQKDFKDFGTESLVLDGLPESFI